MIDIDERMNSGNFGAYVVRAKAARKSQRVDNGQRLIFIIISISVYEKGVFCLK